MRDCLIFSYFWVIVMLTGCCCHKGVFDGGRRPQVLPDPVCSIIDYDFDCEIAGDGPCGYERELKEDIPLERKYTFALGDILEISLLEEEQAYIEAAVVAPDGYLYYAFVDGIPALGRTIEEVSEELQEKLKKYFIDPFITIIPKVANNQEFKILGRIRRPGVYPLTTEINVREAIGIAGDLMTESYKDKDSDSDLLPLADLNRSYLLRNGRKMQIDFTRLLYDPTYANNTLVQANDFIYIAPKETADVYILGAVYTPSRVIWRRDLTLMELLSKAGGWRYGSPLAANLESVLLIRGPLECPCAMCIDVTRILKGSARDFLLQPGDIIYVHNKTMRFGRFLVRVAINSFIQSFAIGASGYYAGTNWFHFSNNSLDIDDDF